MTKAKVNLTQKLMPERRPQLPKALTGIDGLDIITGGGLPKARATLICGSTGTGKTLLAMEFLLKGAMRYNEPGVFMAFEESTTDLIANVNSIGFDLKGLIADKKVVVDFVYIDRDEIVEAGEYNLDALFIRLGAAIDAIGAKRVVLDTIESLFSSLPNPAVLRAELRRLFCWLKEKGVTAVITAEAGTDTKMIAVMSRTLAILITCVLVNPVSRRLPAFAKAKTSLIKSAPNAVLTSMSNFSSPTITSASSISLTSRSFKDNSLIENKPDVNF